MSIAVVLFTRDLRVHDNPALAAASERFEEVVPLFVLDDRLLGSANRTAFLLEALGDLRKSLGGELVVRREDVGQGHPPRLASRRYPLRRPARPTATSQATRATGNGLPERGRTPGRTWSSNPVRQAMRFDPAGDYVRRYLPELASLRVAGSGSSRASAQRCTSPSPRPCSACSTAGPLLRTCSEASREDRHA